MGSKVQVGGKLKPAKLLDQLLGTSGDLSWEVYRVNSLNNFNHFKMNSKLNNDIVSMQVFNKVRNNPDKGGG